MKKILLVTDDAYTYSGRERIFAMMADIYSQNNYVDVFSLKGHGEPFYRYDGVKSMTSFTKYKLPLLRVAKKMYQNDYDYVFIVSMGKLSFSFSILSLILRACKKTKIIACEHVAISSFNPVLRFLKKAAYILYDEVVVLTEHDKKEINKSFANARVIKNPVVYKNIVKEERNKRALAIGRLEEQKNFIELLEIWKLFIVNNDGWILNILGDGRQRESLERKIKELKIESSVILNGKIKDVDFFYRNADFLLMTSIYEGLPLVLLEAKSYSLPCIAYDCPTGPGEIISNGVDGYVVPLHDKNTYLDKINLLCRDDIYHSLSDGTKSTSKEFDFNEIQKQWMDIIK